MVARTVRPNLFRECFDVLFERGAFAWLQKRRSDDKEASPGSVDEVPAIVGLLPSGRFIAVVCKTHGYAPTSRQRVLLDAINRRGGLGVAVYDAADLAEIVDRETRNVRGSAQGNQARAHAGSIDATTNYVRDSSPNEGTERSAGCCSEARCRG